MVGPTRAGKGVIARILSALVGPENVAGPTLSGLGNEFGLAPLIGKPLAIVSDARLGKNNDNVVVERLLSVSGEDTITVNIKYKEQWTGKLPSRFLIISNELPRLGDASGAIANRFAVLQLERSFLGKENHGLESELRKELSGILNWALTGLDRLTEQDRFTRPASTDDVITSLQDLASPVAAFVRDKCERGTGEIVEIDDMYSAWREWCEDNGHRPTTTQTFGRDLKSVVPELRVIRPRVDGGRVRQYAGVSLVKRSRESEITRTGETLQ
jgi:putative DNA primase/helicase